MATSGTVSQTVFETRRVIDHAFRRCRLTPQQITSEYIDTALDDLYLFLSMLVNKGIKLWNIDYIIIPLYEGEYTVPTPVGTVDLLNANLRTLTRFQTGIATASEGDAANAFDADLSTATTQTSGDGNITLQLDTANSITTYGILPNVTGTWDFEFQGSSDGITYTTLITQTSLSVIAEEWFWIDFQGVSNFLYFRLQATNATVLDVTELVFQNAPQEIPLADINRDDFSNLPNKTFTGRPTQFWWNRQSIQPVIELWPSVEFQFTFAQLTCYVQTHVQDVGALTDELDIPQRWYNAIVWNLAAVLAYEIKEVKPDLIPVLERKAAIELNDAWIGETDNAPIFLRPKISPYTR